MLINCAVCCVMIQKRKNKMSHQSRAAKRSMKRKERAFWDICLKFSPYQRHLAQGRQTRSMSTRDTNHVIHRTYYRGHKLRFIEFGLDISHEGAFGYGLRATLAFSAGTPITQYEGMILTKREAENIRSGPDGKLRSTHFASTSTRSMVINGFSLLDPNCITGQGGVPIARSEWRGRGGGSLCNHNDDPNASLARDTEGDGYGVFVVARRNISAGEFIHVDYGKRFIQSSKSNI